MEEEVIRQDPHGDKKEGKGTTQSIHFYTINHFRLLSLNINKCVWIFFFVACNSEYLTLTTPDLDLDLPCFSNQSFTVSNKTVFLEHIHCLVIFFILRNISPCLSIPFLNNDI